MRLFIIGIDCYDLIKVEKRQCRIAIGMGKNHHIKDLFFQSTNLKVLQDFLKRIKRK